ncbi:UDP-4-amino-4,6-dideoxy-N-acetyl-beta-L-altrosamine transaminase [Pseudodesulfovibrio sp. F-1]|uniref:UDP-4-amino-4, 6-dideoxy-N-acetyl-beta-L-altrosamine transaminase n=1 Tax=Pseudodesulfovibrio alkaliphilus TaxID=2661613 RepID=A0A7K1KLK5_9BACT|nr:UDP-4-amino-4,6-dideoxy-N-acetyl-beta-L-altrosamine transaminase [Pseudodesulfovibrio alkaliphilus]MUM76959.1 UDP-4-amino-4,6-dideoxy-N-acetyl-beta-L-altrosamine transaminase [Pseudodesulfovibrio alkaliphilus]
MRKIPYGKQSITEDDIQAVTEALKSDFLTTGPRVPEFESAVAAYCGARYGVAVANGTAALHAAMFALGIGPGDEVVLPPMTFAATANCVLYMGATPVFADVCPDTLLINPDRVRERITTRTRAIIGVDYAGQPGDWDALRKLADERGLSLVADGCHAIGASIDSRKVGTLADMTVFSFHPVKHVTTGEGGMIMTDRDDFDQRLRLFRNHGITTDARSREETGQWFYEMTDLGYNYRLTDIQAALGTSQMRRLPEFLARRREIAAFYDNQFAGTPVRPLAVREGVEHAYHLYVVRISDRDRVFTEIRAAGIGAQVHYIPVHLHPYYRSTLGTGEGLCPVAEEAYRQILSIPMFPTMTAGDKEHVVKTMLELA